MGDIFMRSAAIYLHVYRTSSTILQAGIAMKKQCDLIGTRRIAPRQLP